MSQLRWCPNGHSWEVPGEANDAGDGATVCLVCGAVVSRSAEALTQQYRAGAAASPGNGQEPATDSPTPPRMELPATGLRQPPENGVPEVGEVLPCVSGYQVLEVLGRGGMGVVYRARHLGLDRVVALKMILDGGQANSEDRARFLSEAKAVAQLQHPNIVQIFEFGRHDDLPFFTLEFVAGGSLGNQIRDNPLSPRAGAALVEQLARGMAYAHERGIVHRDLKPANVLLTEDGTPKITDFGLAKCVTSPRGSERIACPGPSLDADLTQTGMILGSPNYMAPEQASGRSKDAGPGADIYALGAILYRLVTGRAPFHAASALETVEQVLRTEPVPPRQLQPRVPHDLETIILKCLRKDPQRRYSSAAALADDLGRWLRGEPITARPTTAFERFAKWVRRKPAQAALGASAVLLFLTFAVGGPLVALRQSSLRARADDALGQARELTRGLDASNEDLARSNRELDRTNENLKQAVEELSTRKKAAELFASEIVYQQGSTLVEGDQQQHGLLLLGRAWSLAPETAELRRKIHEHMTLTQATLPKPVFLIPPVNGAAHVHWAKYTADGTRILLCTDVRPNSKEREVRVVNASMGQPTEVLFPDIAVPKVNKDKVRYKVFDHIQDVASSPDGKTMLAYRKEGTVRRFDLLTGKPIGDSISGKVVELGPDGKKFIIRAPGPQPPMPPFVPPRFSVPGSTGDAVLGQIWDAEEGRPIGKPLRISGPAPGGPVGFSSDGKVLICVDIAASAGVGKPPAVPPTGPRLLPPQVLRRWDTSTGEQQKPLDLPPGHDFRPRDRLHCPRQVQDGRYLVLAVSSPGQVGPAGFLVLDGKTGKPVEKSPWGNLAGLRAVSISRDGQVMATANAGNPVGERLVGSASRSRIRLWGIPSGRPWGTGWDLYGSVESLDFAPDGQALLVCMGNAAIVYDLRTSRPRELPKLADPVLGVAVTADGQFLSITTKQVQRWDPATLEPVGEPLAVPDTFRPIDERSNERATRAVLSPDGRMLVTADERNLYRWDSSSCRAIGEAIRHDPGSLGDRARIVDIQFSADSRIILTRLSTGAVDPYHPLPPGRKVPTFHQLHFWEALTGKLAAKPITMARGTGAFCLSPDGTGLFERRPTGKRDDDYLALPGAASLLRLATLDGAQTLRSVEYPGPVEKARFSPDGKLLLTVERFSGTGQLWDAATLMRAGTPLGEGSIRAFAFRNDGQVLATAQGYEVRPWHLPACRPIGPPLRHPSRVTSLAFSPDGGKLITAGEDQVVRTWDLTSLLPEDSRKLTAALEALTGMELHEDGTAAPLTLTPWTARLRQWPARPAPPRR